MKRLVALLLLAVVSAAFGQELQKFEKCSIVEAGWADGDSFPVKLPDGKEIVLRLYYVDCNEVAAATETDQRRVRDQSSYFGIDDHQVTLEFGRRAADEVKKLLTKPFTVQTAFATAPGRSAKPRTYGFITLSDGRDLGEVLVGEGLARSYGVRRNTPEGVNADTAEAKMDDLELGAAIARRGLWAKTDPQRLVSLREDRRKEERELQEAFGAGGGEPIDPNTATVDEIMLLPGVGEVLAERIVEGRPYKSVDDLRRVPGVGDKVFARLKDSLQIAP
ncbi:MAG: helix-hairpin-helix domain-containing protein [Chthoniobacterales bacterium]